MSKLNNLIGFWNNKSHEEGDNHNKTQNQVNKVRPKSENLDHNFSQRMEFFASPKNLWGGEMKVKFLTDNEPKSHQEPMIKKSVGFGQERASVANGRDIKESDHQSDLQSDTSDRSDALGGDAGDGAHVRVVVTDTDNHPMEAGDFNARKSLSDDAQARQDGKGFLGKFQSPPVSPLVKSAPSLPSTPTSPTSPVSPGWSSPSPGARSGKTQSPFARFKQLEDSSAQGPGSGSRTPPLQPSKGSSSLYRNLSMPASTPRPTLTVKMMDQQQGQARPSLAARSGSGAKEMILMWVQNRIKDYPIPMTNFSTCWNDGLAFCALIHVFYPDNFDWSILKSENRRQNFTLAFQKAEELAGIYPLLEVDDMVRFQKPDWKCVFTYVQSFYRRFRDGRSPPLASRGQSPGAGGQVRMSEVALAIAESEAAEKKGKQIVQMMDKKIAREREDKAEESKNDIKQIPDEVKGSQKDEGKGDIKNTGPEERQVMPTQVAKVRDAAETPEGVHTQVASITLQPSPAKLGPAVKINRSKSVNSEHPTVDQNCKGKERKLSFNQPMPSSCPPALKL